MLLNKNNLLKIYILFTILLLIVIYLNLSNTLICEHPGEESTMFYKIKQIESNEFEVIFWNVNVKYNVYAMEIPGDYHLTRFKFKQLQAVNPVCCDRFNNNIKDAVMAHFNDIQRGEFHPNRPNVINPNAHGRGIRSPLDQFEIRDFLSIEAPILGNLRISLTNITLYLTISAYIAVTIAILTNNFNKMLGNKWSLSQETIYATIHSIVRNQIDNKTGQSYYPFIYCLFIIILVSNLIGMVPYSFASTSHFILAFFLSFSIVLGSTILGFLLHNIKFFSLFVPSGCPLGLLPLLVLIEFISFLARNVSLGLRLAANILSGHMLLNILSDFTYKIMETNFIYFFVGLIPLMFIVAFSALELAIAFIQSQVFVVLSCSYIKDSKDLH